MREEKMKLAKVKAGTFCAYQERTHREVRNKLFKLGLYGDEVEEVLTQLITENFVNEERYAKAFAADKFRLNHWGKVKIEYELRQKDISSYCIDKALEQISDEEYEKEIKELIGQKKKQVSGDSFVLKNKIARYLMAKGFESEVVWSVLNDLL